MIGSETLRFAYLIICNGHDDVDMIGEVARGAIMCHELFFSFFFIPPRIISSIPTAYIKIMESELEEKLFFFWLECQ